MRTMIYETGRLDYKHLLTLIHDGCLALANVPQRGGGYDERLALRLAEMGPVEVAVGSKKSRRKRKGCAYFVVVGPVGEASAELRRYRGEWR